MQINLAEALQNVATVVDHGSDESANAMIAPSFNPIAPRNSVQPEPESDTSVILTRPNPDCAVCGRLGESLYAGLTDRLFGASGKWSLKRCPGIACGLIWLDPVPLESEIHHAYETYYTHPLEAAKISRCRDLYYRANYRLKAIHLRTRFGARGERRSAMAILTWIALGPYIPTRAIVEFPMRYLPKPQTGRILEIGFGYGRTIAQLRELGWEAEGLETDIVTVADARLRGLKVSGGTLLEQNYPDGHFDAIVSNHVLEHVHDPKELLVESRRILRPGGRFIAATPNAASLGHRIFGSDWRGLEPPRHLQIFTSSAITALARSAGFEHPTSVGSSRGAALIWNLSRRQRKVGAHSASLLMGTEPVPWSISAFAAEIMECLLAPIAPELAEEVILIAEK